MIISIKGIILILLGDFLLSYRMINPSPNQYISIITANIIIITGIYLLYKESPTNLGDNEE